MSYWLLCFLQRQETYTEKKINEVWKALSTLHTEKEAYKKSQEQEATEGKLFLCGKKK